MQKKESYRHLLPHFQQAGQSYFVTWCLKDAVPAKALVSYTNQLAALKAEIDIAKANKEEPEAIEEMLYTYRITRKRYLKTFDDILDLEHKQSINLSLPNLTQIIKDTLLNFEGTKIENYAFCIMPNHIHWVFRTFETDAEGNPVYLQDILQSVKRFSANRINEALKRKGSLWQKESFDTTIRDREHQHNAIEYTLNNPIKAGLVKSREEWSGNWCKDWF